MWRFEFAVVADLTANVFAACFLLFLVGWQTGVFGSATTEVPLEVTYRVQDVATLSGSEKVGMLYRRSDDNALRLDLRQDHVLLLAPGSPAVKVELQNLGSALAGLAGPAELYVFANDLYYPVTSVLSVRQITWREIDVPQALRGGASEPFGWSSGFLSLMAQKPDAASFSAGLARLLDAAASRTPNSGAGGGTVGAASSQASLLERIAGTLGAWLTWVCLVAGFGLVVFTEWRYPAEKAK